MSEENSMGTWPKIIEAVTSIMGLSALAVLAAGAAFTAVLVQTPKEEQFSTFVVLAVLVLVLVFSNMIYAYFMQRHELTFRVRVARIHNGVETPCEDMGINLYKNGNLIQSSSTDEMGMQQFSIRKMRISM